MGLFSLLHKKKQEPASSEGEYLSRSEEESGAVRGRGKRKSASDAIDPVLPEKKRARRRLVGAIALVLAAVIGLPMILDSEPKPLADDISIQIPSRDKISQQIAAVSSASASTSYDKKLDNGAGSTVAAASASAATSIAASVPAASAAGKSVDAGKSPELAGSVIDKAASSAIPAVNPDHKADAKPASRPDASAERVAPKTADNSATSSATVDKADDAARATAILEAKPEPKPNSSKSAEQKTGKFAVQVAALATQEKVNELRAQLKDAGIETYTQKVATESGERTRIRVGPFASKDEAEKLRARLIKMGLTGTLIPPAR